MKIPALRIASLAALIVTTCISTGMGGRPVDPELQEIAGYREWHRLTEKPIVVKDFVAGG